MQANVWHGELAMKIKRDKLLSDLQDFVLCGNGVIIGNAGVGKTYLLKELRRNLETDEIPELLLPIDKLGDGTDETIERELELEENLIDFLDSIPLTEKKGIIIFDAYDAARNEQTRKNFLDLIRRAIQKLERWNIVVSVRTYDATKSQELLNLFGNQDDTDLTEYQNKEVLCRHFTIQPFNKDEILQALDQIQSSNNIENLTRIYYDGSPDFKQILAIPFNLWLLNKIVKFASPEEITDISQIRSEVQLFGRFWQQRVDDTNEHVLRQISNQMVELRSLSVRIGDIYDKIDLDNPVRKIAWDKLQSDEILAKVSSTGQRIAFSHNILFDYAISVLHIDDKPQHFENFITEDPSRPLFLRPSLTYFFTRLWYYEDSEDFWSAFWHILRSDQSVHLRLVARLIPTSVIAIEARAIEELKEPIQKFQNGEPIAVEATTRLFQALQALQITREKPWIEFCDQVLKYLHVDFAWDLANLTTDILEKTTDSNVKKVCGHIGRRLLKWVWQEREINEDDWINRFGGRWAVPLVAKTYNTDKDASRALLEKVLELTEEENFPISFLTWLTENVDNIWISDPDFVADIYRIVFGHIETSKEKRNMGGYVLQMTSFRAQDYSMCQYRLEKHFPKFLRDYPKHATQAAIHSLNHIIAKEHIFQFSRKDMTFEELTESFYFHGKTANFVQDHSHIWDARSTSNEPNEMADTLFQYISELADVEEKHSLLDSLLDVFIDHVLAAFFWKRLLKTASQFPKVFAPRLYELCIAKPILLHLEVSYELGLFLENAASEFTSEQLRQIEECILALPTDAKDMENDEYLILHRDSLITRIPKNLLSTKKAKLIRKKMERDNNVLENNPPFDLTIRSETVTEEKYLRDRGVDTTTPENQKLQRLSDSLEDFITAWRNKKPTHEDAELILPKLEEVHNDTTGKTNTDDELINTLWRKITECSAILGRISNDLDENSFDLCRSILLEGASHKLPDPDQENDENFDFPGYSSQVRHYAAEGLLRIFFYKHDLELISIIEKLADDKVPSVRMITAMHLSNLYNKEPDRFWEIINKRSEKESNPIVQECLYSALSYVIRPTKENEEQTAQVMEKILEKTPLPQQKMGTYDPFSFLIIGLAIVGQNGWALKTINEEFLKDPIKYANLLSRLIKQIIKGYVDPKHVQNTNFQNNLKRAITILNSIVTETIPEINVLSSTYREQRTEKVEKELRNTYSVLDQIITSLYFTFSHKDISETKSAEENEDKGIYILIFNEIYPLMQQIVNFAKDSENGLMFAPTAHYFMQLLTNFLSCDPERVIILADGVAKSSERFGYNLDSIAVKDIVDFVEIVLADYRQVVRDNDDCMESLLNLLDLFAKTGWTDALNLVWRLDEVFR